MSQDLLRLVQHKDIEPNTWWNLSQAIQANTVPGVSFNLRRTLVIQVAVEVQSLTTLPNECLPMTNEEN
jgi:hypothetical protein